MILTAAQQLQKSNLNQKRIKSFRRIFILTVESMHCRKEYLTINFFFFFSLMCLLIEHKNYFILQNCKTKRNGRNNEKHLTFLL